MFTAALDRTCRTCDDVEAVVEDGGRGTPLPDGGAPRRAILLAGLRRRKSGCTTQTFKFYVTRIEPQSSQIFALEPVQMVILTLHRVQGAH